MPTQDSLTTYGATTAADGPPSSSLRPPQRSIDLIRTADEYITYSRDRDDLPDIEGFGWEAAIEQYGSTEVTEWWRLDPRTHWDEDVDHESIPGSGGIITSNASAYLDSYALAPIDFPDYYTRFEDLDPVFRWSVDSRTRLSHHDIKRCIRLTNGSGRIQTNETELVLCAPGTVVAAGPRGIFLIDIPQTRGRTTDSLPAPPEEVYHSVGGINIPEEHPQLRAGFKRLQKLLVAANRPKLEAYDHFEESHHVVRTTTDEQVELSWNSLQRLAVHTDTPSTLQQGTYEHYCEGETHTATIDATDIPGKIGDYVQLAPDPDRGIEPTETTTGYVAGYRVEWSEKEYICSHGVHELTLDLIVLLITENLSIKQVRIPVTEKEP